MNEMSNHQSMHENQGINDVQGLEQEYDFDDDDDEVSTPEVVHRIENVALRILQSLDRMEIPEMGSTVKKRFNERQARSFTSMFLVMAYCQQLLQSTDEYGRARSTTTREVYYYYITYFRSQRECDTAIKDVCILLEVPRHSLGLHASSKGWICGDIQLLDPHNGTVQWNGRAHRGDRGCPVSFEWLLSKKKRSFVLSRSTTATCILVVEKEGIYQRLVQDGVCDLENCVLITGKGFPDLATRACVHALHHELHLPVLGLADCDPFGIAVLNCYCGGTVETTPMIEGRGDRYAVPMFWLGLRASQVKHLSKPSIFHHVSYPALPSAVFQPLTDIDRQRLMDHFWTDETQPFMIDQHPARLHETHEMISTKVELEALYWLGMDFCSLFVGYLIRSSGQQMRRLHQDENRGFTNTIAGEANHLGATNEIADTEEVDWTWKDII